MTPLKPKKPRCAARRTAGNAAPRFHRPSKRSLRSQDELAAAVAEFTELWKKGELEGAGKQSGFGVLTGLVAPDVPITKLPGKPLHLLHRM